MLVFIIVLFCFISLFFNLFDTVRCLQATDPDSSVITYRIIAGNTPDGAFQLHSISGQLTLRRPLRKQDGRQFELTVIASDGVLNDTARIIVDLLVRVSTNYFL